MCGIVGIFNFKDSAYKEKRFVEDSLCTMKHRGADSKKTWEHQNYIVGFTRLAIRDLSPGADQPMISDDKNYSIAFNGEIYNTPFFKDQLQGKGIYFKTTSDTEVLLYSLIELGFNYVLENADGMFAFAFYDVRQNVLLLARDRAGIKPLYIGKSYNGIVFSSQYDHVIKHRYISNNSIDEGALGAYLSLGYVPENTGVVSNTWLLPHGYYSLVSATGISTTKYYTYPLIDQVRPKASLDDLLAVKVREQLVSDVPIGTFMSGGVDSPLVSYYASKEMRIKSFNIGLEDKSLDESDAANSYATIFKTSHYCKHISEGDLLDVIAGNTKAFSEPFADFSSIPTLILSKFAKEHVTVALSGDGGDELFWGYPRSARMLNEAKAFRHPKSLRMIKLITQKLFSKERVLRRRHIEVDDPASYYYRSLYITGADYWIPKLFKGKATPAFFYNEIVEEARSPSLTEAQIMRLVRKLEYDIHLQRILLKVDRASMYHTLEVRVPFLSNAIIQYSSQLPHTECISNGEGKVNLKKMLASVSDPSLVYQPKKGFTIPLGEWIRGPLKKDIHNKLLGMPSELKPFFDSDQIEKLLKQHYSGKIDWSWFIWSLFSLINWHSVHRKV